jgi:hypothetical protein
MIYRLGTIDGRCTRMPDIALSWPFIGKIGRHA